MYNRRPSFEDGPFHDRRPGPEDRDMVDLRHLMRMLWRRRNVVIFCTLVFSVLAFAGVSQVTPMYTSLSKVMLDARKGQVTGDAEVVSDLDISDPVVNSETAVLRSNILIESAIREIGLDRFDVIDPANDGPSLTQRITGPIKAAAQWVGLASKPKQLTPEQIEKFKVERLVYAVRKRLSVRREGKSYVIGIWVETEDAQLSMLLAKTLAQKYIEQQLRGRQAVAQEATQWIEDRLAVLRKELDAAEAASVKYRMESLALDGSSLETVTQQMFELSNKAAEARADRTLAEATLNQLEAVIREKGIKEAGKLLTSPLMEELNAERVKLVLEDGVWARDYDENHPSRKRLAGEIAVIDAELTREVEKIVTQQRGEVSAARAREQSIQKSLEEMEARIVSISTNALGLEELQRKTDASRQAYEELLNRLTEVRSQELLQKADARVIEQATIAGAPSSPKPKLVTAMGGMVGFALGLGLVFFLELSTSTFRTEQEIESETNLPVLAALQTGDWQDSVDSYLEVLYEPNGEYAERVRQLRTSTLMFDPHGKGQTMLITSSTPAEGKTTTSLNLATMAAKAGKSVVLIDCDLRRSTLHKNFGWDLGYGLSDYLSNDCSLDEAIYSDPHMPFDVLTSRGSHEQAVDTLSKGKLSNMLRLLEQAYDVVIIDSPPVLAVADSLLIAQAVDNVVFVVRWNETPKKSVKKALDMLSDVKARPKGVVLNMVDPKEYAAEFVGGYYSYEA